MQIIPSIFVSSKEKFLEQTRAVEELVDLVQIDIADGKFVSAATWTDPEVVARELKTNCELHLMVRDPVATILKWKNVSQVKRAIVHYESTDDLHPIIKMIHDFGWDASLVINPETPVEALAAYLGQIEGVMFMDVHPGAQGQPPVSGVLDKVSDFKKKHPNIFVELDGGVSEQTLPEIMKSGVDAICPGSAIFGNEHTPKENLERLKKLIREIDRNKTG